MRAVQAFSRELALSLERGLRHGDVLLALAVLATVSVMVVPTAPWLLDLLQTLSLAVSACLFLIAMSVASPTQLASFPSILLLTTLLRLSLTIAAARMILLEGRAGHVIHAFGTFALQGDVFVGATVFLIISLIQLMVVAKGSERVAEVSARFALDAMPGKQMAIDADLRSGTIDLETAQKRRKTLALESQLFGAMDGAMKLVKGDAIAGLTVTAVTFVVGLALGVVRDGLSLEDALTTYSVLSIGDGLAAQLPSLLVSLSAGMLTTRVEPQDARGHLADLLSFELLAHPKAIGLTGVFLGVVALVPGMPSVPFLALGCAALFGARHLHLRRTEVPTSGESADDVVPGENAARDVDQQHGVADAMIPIVTPILLELAPALHERLHEDGGAALQSRLRALRDALFFELGVHFPIIRVRANPHLPSGDAYVIYVDEVPVRHETVPSRLLLVSATPDRLRMLNVTPEPVASPLAERPKSWVKAKHRSVLEAAGLEVAEAEELIIIDLAAVLRRRASAFLGLQDVQRLLEQLEPSFPALVRETVPKLLGVPRLAQVLRRLLDEGISIRDSKRILESIAVWAPLVDDTHELVERVRIDLACHITNQHTRGGNRVRALLLDPVLEDTLRSAIVLRHTGPEVVLDPELADALHSAVRETAARARSFGAGPVFLTAPELRSALQGLLRRELPGVRVLSFAELEPEVVIEPIAQLRI